MFIVFYILYINWMQEVHYIHSSMSFSLKPSQYSNDAAEIHVRKTDYHVMCIVFGNIPHDIQSLEVYDLTFCHGLKH